MRDYNLSGYGDNPVHVDEAYHTATQRALPTRKPGLPRWMLWWLKWLVLSLSSFIAGIMVHRLWSWGAVVFVLLWLVMLAACVSSIIADAGRKDDLYGD